MTALSQVAALSDHSSRTTLLVSDSLRDVIRREIINSLRTQSTTALYLQAGTCLLSVGGCVVSFWSGRYVFDRNKMMTVDARISCAALLLLHGGVTLPLLATELARRARSENPFPARPYEAVATDKVVKTGVHKTVALATSLYLATRGRAPFHKNARSTFGRVLSGLDVIGRANQAVVCASELMLRDDEVRQGARQLMFVAREVTTDARSRGVRVFRR